MFAEALIAALTILAPENGSEVDLLSKVQKDYLALPKAQRFAKFDNATFRAELAKTGDRPAEVRLEWSGDPVAVYLLSVDDQLFTVTNRCYARITNLEPGHTYRWSVRAAGDTDSASATFSTADELPRVMYAEGVHNLRDLGGWRTKSGRRVRFGRVYRSAGFRNGARRSGNSLLNVRYTPGGQRVTDFGIAALKDDLKIRTDIELRTRKEAMCMKSSLIPGARWVHLPFLAYDLIADDVQGRLQFARIFREFLDEKNYPVIFHCSGGRDRTGTVAFLLNGLLGVSEDDLCRDWEVTAFDDGAMSLNTDRIVRLLDYLHTMAGENLNEQIESYVRSCGVSEAEIARFRALMLEGGVK